MFDDNYWQELVRRIMTSLVLSPHSGSVDKLNRLVIISIIIVIIITIVITIRLVGGSLPTTGVDTVTDFARKAKS